MVCTLLFSAVEKGLHSLSFFLSIIIKVCTLPFSVVWLGSTLFAILSSMIRVYTVCFYPKQSDQGLHCLPFFLSIIIKVYTVGHSQRSDQGLQYLPFSAVLSGTTLFAILSSLIKVKFHTVILRNSLVRIYTLCPSQKSDLVLHCLPFSAVWSTSNQVLYCLPFSAVWSGSTLFAILSLIRVYSFCYSQQSDQGLHYLSFFLSSITKLYTVCHS